VELKPPLNALVKPTFGTVMISITLFKQAGEMLGNKLIYLEAGSGAKHAVPLE
jgi:heptaprenylglyceryl phosphate synthase